MEILDYIQRGGIIVYILIFLNILGFTIILWKLIVFTLIKFKKRLIVEHIVNKVSLSTNKFEERSFNNLLNKEIYDLETGLNTIKIIASISPLLGLLGTVIGVLNSFDAISKLGLGNPSIFSAGISIALITTVAGLIVSIPHYIAYNYFISSLNKLEHSIEESVINKL